jgi:hypothetical protein
LTFLPELQKTVSRNLVRTDYVVRMEIKGSGKRKQKVEKIKN